MEFAVAGVVLLAASIHPFRELILKSNAFPEAAYFGVIIVWVGIAVTHALIIGVDIASVYAVWPLVVISAFSLMFYYIGILTTMKTGTSPSITRSSAQRPCSSSSSAGCCWASATGR